MNQRSFPGWSQPQIRYDFFPMSRKDPEEIPIPEHAKVWIPTPFDSRRTLDFKPGDPVATGAKLASESAYALSGVTGTVERIDGVAGDFGKDYTVVTIKAEKTDRFAEPGADWKENPDLQAAVEHFEGLPGAPNFREIAATDPPLKTIVITAADDDLMVFTQRYVLDRRLPVLRSGIQALRKITGAERIVLAVPKESMQGHGHIGAEVLPVPLEYPSAIPKMIVFKMLGEVVPAGSSPRDLGVAFMKAEAVAALGEAYETGRLPTQKLLTVIAKDGSCRLMAARLGTPIGDLLRAAGISAKYRDRIILGGPMRGVAVYSEEHPVLPDTDAIMVQDAEDLAHVSDYPCVNCGECVRACPVKIPVNMMVRFLEAGQYNDAADGYDLLSCVECGICSFVCVAKIPIFQYIRLAKHEIARLRNAEAANE